MCTNDVHHLYWINENTSLIKLLITTLKYICPYSTSISSNIPEGWTSKGANSTLKEIQILQVTLRYSSNVTGYLNQLADLLKICQGLQTLHLVSIPSSPFEAKHITECVI